ncbi:MAG: hypothetical protein Q4C71_05675 [Microbacteriaceae bacterium]|nr:hypothetical protein [Microbacteriaceae bacterium]
MKNTPRLLNRLVLLVTGLVLLAFGAALLVYLSAHKVIEPYWKGATQAIGDFAQKLDQSYQVGENEVHVQWLYVIFFALVVLAIIFFVVLLSLQGGGKIANIFKTKNAVTRKSSDAAAPKSESDTEANVDAADLAAENSKVEFATGRDAATPGFSVISTSLAEQLLQQRFEGDPEILSVHAACFVVKKERVMRVNVQVRKGSYLPDLVDRLQRAIVELDAALGAELPVIIEIGTGVVQTVFRSSAPRVI